MKRKIIVVIIASVLAFIVAVGDQISGEEKFFSLSGLKSIFTSEKDTPNKTPRIPKLKQDKPIEENLSYSERIAKGDYYFDRNFLSYAAEEYSKAAILNPQSTEPYLKLLKTNFELQNFPQAEINSAQILTLDSKNYTAKLYELLISIGKNNLTEAKKQSEKLANEFPNEIKPNYYKGLIYIALGYHTEGRNVLENLSKNPTTPSTLNKNITNIISAFQQYEFAASAESLYLSELLAKALVDAKEYEMAVYKTKNILKSRADLRDAWILLGFSYMNLKQYTFAINAFQSAYKLDSSWPSTQYFMGLAYYELDNYNDAIVYLNYALKNGFTPELVVKQKLADLYLEVKDYKKSVKEYEDILKTKSNDVNAYVRPIWIYIDLLNEPQKAFNLAQVAFLNFPQDAMAYNLMGWSQVGMKQYDEAEKNLKKAIEIDSKLTAAYYNLGKLYETIDKKQYALEQYKQAFNLDQTGSIGDLAAKRYNAIYLELN